jgi:hypothetical protein
MTVEEFRVADGVKFSGALLALWWDGRGNWDKAHEVTQEVEGRDGLGACLSASQGGGSGECGVLVSSGWEGCGDGGFEGRVGADCGGDSGARRMKSVCASHE